MTFTEKYKQSLDAALGTIDLTRVDRAISWLKEARDNGRQIFTCGNGGSASTASHFVVDVLKGASYGKDKRFKILALTDSIGTITAYANDVAYNAVFVEQLKNWAKPGDILLAISGSGDSPNVLRAVEYANSIGCKTIGLTGRDGGKLAPMSQLNIHTAEPHMGRIEDTHLIVCHMLCYYFMEEAA